MPDPMRTDPKILKRQLLAYIPVAVIFLGIILVVFQEATRARLTEGHWRRGDYVYADSFSLDLHAVLGYVFVFGVLLQLVTGSALLKFPGTRRFHRAVGKMMGYFIVPVFLAGAAWASFDRSTNIATEVSVIFKTSRDLIRVVLAILILFSAGYFVLAIRAIRSNRVHRHVDYILAFWGTVSAIAVIRFLYAMFWALREDGSPFSVVAMYFLTVAVVCVLLFVAYLCAGRLRRNVRTLGAFAGVNILFAVVASPWYSIWYIEEGATAQIGPPSTTLSANGNSQVIARALAHDPALILADGTHGQPRPGAHHQHSRPAAGPAGRARLGHGDGDAQPRGRGLGRSPGAHRRRPRGGPTRRRACVSPRRHLGSCARAAPRTS